jgi:hypothetical protein
VSRYRGRLATIASAALVRGERPRCLCGRLTYAPLSSSGRPGRGRDRRQPLRPMFEAAPSVTSPLSLCRAAASGHQCANAVAAAKAYEDYKHERNERGHQNTPEDSCLTYWNPKRREYERCALGAQDRRPIRNADALPRDVESMRAAATPSGSGINVTSVRK